MTTAHNTCPDCGTNLPAGDSVCPQCVHVRRARKKGHFVQARPTVQPATVNLKIGEDRTGSSKQYAPRIRRGTASLVTRLSPRVAQLNVDVYTHGDLDYDEPFCTGCVDATPAEAEAYLMAIEFAGGGDPAEHHLDAAAEILSRVALPSGPYERNVVVIFTSSDTKRLRDGTTPDALGRAYRERGVITVLVGPPDPMLEAFVDAAGGFYYPITADPTDADWDAVVGKVIGSIVDSTAVGMVKVV